MFQIEIYEYSRKLSEIYYYYYNHLENNINTQLDNIHNEENLENKFLKIKNLKHPFISRYLDMIKDENNYLFISEINGDSLEEIIDLKLSENTKFNHDEVIKIIYQIILSVNFLESHGCYLKFIDPKRILIQDDNVKLRNYIVDLLFKNDELKFISNFKYLAPELIFYPEIQHNCKSVVWSIGLIALELLINIQKFPFHQNLFFYYSSNEFIKDYIEILLKYKDSTIFSKVERGVLYNSKDPRLLLEYFVNGYFVDKDSLSLEFKDFLSNCLHVDCDKRKNASFLLNHPLFDKVKHQVNLKSTYYMIPIEKDYIKNINNQEYKGKNATGQDNYEIFKNILKINTITLLEKKGVLDYKPKIMNIPQYFSLFSSEEDEYNLNEEETISSIKIKKPFPVENIYDKEFNNREFNEGCLIYCGSYVINLPYDYDKENLVMENFIKSNIYDIQLFKSEGLKSDKSSNSDHSKFSVKESLSVKGELNRSSSHKFPTQNLDKEINHYFKIRNHVYNIIFQTGYSRKEDLIVDIKKMNYIIPSNYRGLIYLILLDIDILNDIEELDLGLCYENRNFIQKELSQIKKDISRCDEYDNLFKTDEGKYYLNIIFESLLYNKNDFFYNQGMDSILSAHIKLFYSNNEIVYQVFYKFIKKLLYIFYDIENKTIHSLNFQHLIISRLILFIDPELYQYLDKINFFETQYATNWILTLFSRTFKYDILYKIWDVLLLENINILYLFVCFILKHNKDYIMLNSNETLIKELNEISDYIKIDPIINDVIKLYKFIPLSLLPINYEYNEEVVKELMKNEFFKNRWWEFENYNTDKYKVPILNMEDILKYYDRILFVDIRTQQEYDNYRIKDSYFLGLNKNKYSETTINILEKSNGLKMVVLIGNKISVYNEYINLLIMKKIKLVTLLQGGIDILLLEEPNLIIKK